MSDMFPILSIICQVLFVTVEPLEVTAGML